MVHQSFCADGTGFPTGVTVVALSVTIGPDVTCGEEV